MFEPIFSIDEPTDKVEYAHTEVTLMRERVAAYNATIASLEADDPYAINANLQHVARVYRENMNGGDSGDE